VVANFLFFDQRLLPRAFHTKARSHCTIAAPLGLLGFAALALQKTGEVTYHGCWVSRDFYSCT
jgi:hypothetical protein